MKKQFVAFLEVELRICTGIPPTDQVTILIRICDTDGPGDLKGYAVRLHCIQTESSRIGGKGRLPQPRSFVAIQVTMEVSCVPSRLSA